MPLPSFTNFVAGMKITAAQLNNNTQDAFGKTVMYKPVCHIYNTGTQSVSSGPVTLLAMNATKLVTDNMADLANSRIVFNTPGIYRITAQVAFTSNATGYRFGAISKSSAAGGNGIACSAHAATSTDFRMNFSVIERMTVGDYVLLGASQTSGVAVATNSGAGGCFISAEWISA